ncbi:MAG TPA: LysR family transcriptional regulator [Gaiellaceae bacterium]|nr:LysR family transcriptional regulator [Gaiellaceae bacterium]
MGWPGVELRHLAALEAVAREGSFRGAGAVLGYAQPAISQQIAALEAAVGMRLVDRRRGRGVVALTEGGELLLAYAQEIGARLRTARSELTELQSRRIAV